MKIDKKYNKNGQLVSTCPYFDNKKNGDEIIYYEYWYSELYSFSIMDSELSDLNISSICPYVNGDAHGECKVYHSDGRLMKIISYMNGVEQSEVFMTT